MSYLCGRPLPSPGGSAPPFDEIVFVGYEDGPTSGAARCRSGTDCYRFELLARDTDGTYDHGAWDRGEEIRIFSLAELPAENYHRLAEVLADEETRERIVDDEGAFGQVAEILEGSAEPRLVVANHGIATPVTAAREVSPGTLAEVTDWFAFLAIPPED